MTNGEDSQPSKTIRRILTAFIVFHLSAVIAAPNFFKYSFLSNKVPLMWRYLNSLSLASAWSFFAPEPGPPPVYVEWETVGLGGQFIGKGRWPEYPNPYFLRERQNRRIAAAYSMVSSDLRAERMLVPYLCRQNPKTVSVRLWSVIYQVPSIDDVSKGVRVVGDETGLRRHWVSDSFCEEFNL